MSFIYIGAILLVVKFWHCNQTPVLGKCLRLSFVKIHQLHLLLGPFIALHQRLTTGPTGRRVKIIEKFTGTMGNNGGKQKQKKKKTMPFVWWKVHMGFIYCIVFHLENPFLTSLAEALFFRMESMALGKVHFGGANRAPEFRSFLDEIIPRLT